MTYGTSEIQSDWAWRLPFLLQMVPALMVGFGIHLFPFSPRWLVMRNRNDESLQSLCRLRGIPADDERVQIEWKGIIADVRLEREVLRRRHGESSGVALEFKIWYDLFTRYRSRTFVAVGVMFFQQVCLSPILSVRWLLTEYKVLRNKCLRLLRSDSLYSPRPR
jgi:MFS family permease